MDITHDYINQRYQSHVFVNDPNEASDLHILYKNAMNNQIPFFSIIVPVCNQEDIIVKNIKSILKYTEGHYFELIIIVDCCSDNTEKNLMNYIQTEDLCSYKLLTNVLIIKSNIPLFETAADNLGFFCSSGQYCLEIQADMEMTEHAYNMKLLKPFTMDERIIGISGRCCHDFKCTKGVGKLGADITKPLNALHTIDTKAYYIGETCNRGPLLIDKKKLIELKYLDEVNYFLDNSDHDLFARAFILKSWICGYVPIDFIALLENGTTRKPRDSMNDAYYKKHIIYKNGGRNGFLFRNINSIPYRDIVKVPLYTLEDLKPHP